MRYNQTTRNSPSLPATVGRPPILWRRLKLRFKFSTDRGSRNRFKKFLEHDGYKLVGDKVVAPENEATNGDDPPKKRKAPARNGGAAKKQNVDTESEEESTGEDAEEEAT